MFKFTLSPVRLLLLAVAIAVSKRHLLVRRVSRFRLHHPRGHFVDRSYLKHR